jgi:uncharacterized damage-inducible protein DinB
MNVRFKKAFDKLEKQRDFLLHHVSLLPVEKYSSTINNGWSVSEILIHLVTSERLSINYMKKKALGIESLENSGLVEVIKMQLLRLSQRLPVKYKAPNIIVDHTPAAIPFDSLRREWDEVRQELKLFAERMADNHVKKKVFKHPVAGRLDLFQAMDFFFEHIQHHWPQIKGLSG